MEYVRQGSWMGLDRDKFLNNTIEIIYENLNYLPRFFSNFLFFMIPFPLVCMWLSPPPALDLSLSPHRHPFLCIPPSSRFIYVTKIKFPVVTNFKLVTPRRMHRSFREQRDKTNDTRRLSCSCDGNLRGRHGHHLAQTSTHQASYLIIWVEEFTRPTSSMPNQTSTLGDLNLESPHSMSPTTHKHILSPQSPHTLCLQQHPTTHAMYVELEKTSSNEPNTRFVSLAGSACIWLSNQM